MGVAFVSVQVFVACALFDAFLQWWQWLGGTLVFVGLVIA